MRIAILGTLQFMREKFYSNRLIDAWSMSNPLTCDRIDQLMQFFPTHTKILLRQIAKHGTAINLTLERYKTKQQYLAYDRFLTFLCNLFRRSGTSENSLKSF